MSWYEVYAVCKIMAAIFFQAKTCELIIMKNKLWVEVVIWGWAKFGLYKDVDYIASVNRIFQYYWNYINGLMQNCSISSVLLGLHGLFCPKKAATLKHSFTPVH